MHLLNVYLRLFIAKGTWHSRSVWTRTFAMLVHLPCALLMLLLLPDSSPATIWTSNYKRVLTTSWYNCCMKPAFEKSVIPCATTWNPGGPGMNFSVSVLENGTQLCEKESHEVNDQETNCKQTFIRIQPLAVQEVSCSDKPQKNATTSVNGSTFSVVVASSTPRYEMETQHTSSSYKDSSQPDATTKIDRKVFITATAKWNVYQWHYFSLHICFTTRCLFTLLSFLVLQRAWGRRHAFHSYSSQLGE